MKLVGKVIVTAKTKIDEQWQEVSNYANCYIQPSEEKIKELGKELLQGLYLQYKTLEDINCRYEDAKVEVG
jgi:phosphoribosylaminoimidazole-succinocarboxamide synthase